MEKLRIFNNVNFNHNYYDVVKKLDARKLSMMQACFLLHLNKRSIYRYLAAFRKNDLNFFLKKERYNLGSQKFSEKEKKIATIFILKISKENI